MNMKDIEISACSIFSRISPHLSAYEFFFNILDLIYLFIYDNLSQLVRNNINQYILRFFKIALDL